MATDLKNDVAVGDYQFGFHDPTDDYVFKSRKGIDAEIVREISAMKKEPQWMLDFRLKALEVYESKPMPKWGGDLDGLEAVVSPRAIVLRNNSTVLAYEKLEPRTEVLRGTLDGPFVVEEWGVKYLVDPLVGQKTGLFLDQKENRRRLRQWCDGRTMWDVFAYAGGWGLNALAAGARHVTFVDSSATAHWARNQSWPQMKSQTTCASIHSKQSIGASGSHHSRSVLSA